ncbi:PD-(D/E)XK nuclease family protein [Pontibacter sp. KCTC 32443]|uniref:PD-(D/E)XK nuclease family protein n=1 Tax=Pontibacter TaxID=323449 RepID=UPI00164D7FE3|nr:MULTISPECIES: PD-(D/E)XK nuclease family protein [Pontibacter]MBC5774341.1 PD-(D/E)XK nuclease family protein [Pontibacter sp. KCTC 32443]
MEIAEQKTTPVFVKLMPLSDLQALINSHLKKLRNLVSNDKLLKLAYKYTVFQKKEIDIGLNIFQLISSTYYKENFHSDILHAILDPDGRHKEGAMFLHTFIDFINEHSMRVSVRREEYQNAVVERETGRIDISIKDVSSKKAIIIENKINDAVDMERQIPRYVEHLNRRGFEVDLIVYIVLNGNKQPNTHDWSQQERDSILPKVFPVSAYNETPGDFYNGWLTKCEKQTQNIDTLFLLRQYNNLIAHLGGKNMNKPLMEEFLQDMLVEDKYNAAISLNAMLQDLIQYRRDKIIDEFRFSYLPFTRIRDWNNYAVIENYFYKESNFALDVIVEQDRYRAQFFDRNYDKNKAPLSQTNPATAVLEKLNILSDFAVAGDRWEKHFLFPSQEKELYEFIAAFISQLKKYNELPVLTEQ